MHMREQYILQPTESSPATGNSSSQRQRMTAWSGDTWAAGSIIRAMQILLSICYANLLSARKVGNIAWNPTVVSIA